MLLNGRCRKIANIPIPDFIALLCYEIILGDNYLVAGGGAI